MSGSASSLTERDKIKQMASDKLNLLVDGAAASALETFEKFRNSSINRHYDTLNEGFRSAEVNYNAGNVEQALIRLTKFCAIYPELLSEHPEYKLFKSAAVDKAEENKLKAPHIVGELKKRLNEIYSRKIAASEKEKRKEAENERLKKFRELSKQFHDRQLAMSRAGSGDGGKNVKNESEYNICPICLGSYSELRARNVNMVSLACGHVFCRPCLDKALAAFKKCPTCREEVNERDIRRIFV